MKEATNVGTKITIIYRDSNGNEHNSYEAACIAQVLLDSPAIYIEPYKLRAIAEVIANYFYPTPPTFEASTAKGQQDAVELVKQMENLHG